jgi:hypothetical protein
MNQTTSNKLIGLMMMLTGLSGLLLYIYGLFIPEYQFWLIAVPVAVGIILLFILVIILGWFGWNSK